MDKSSLFIYLHGFNSAPSPSSEKVATLKHLREVICLAYDTFDTRENIIKYLTKQVENLDSNQVERNGCVLVGTSLGGYYTSVLAKLTGKPSILINPAMNPVEFMIESSGQTYENYETGELRKLTKEVALTYENHPVDVAVKSYKYRPLVLLDAGDDLLDSNVTKRQLSQFDVHLFDGGSHRFEHMKEALPIISEYVDRCKNDSDLND